MKRRVTYRPSKASGVVGGIMGGIFVLIGIFVAIPVFGPFGILWTLFAVVITGSSLYQSFGKGYRGPEIEIEDDRPAGGPTPSETAGTAEERFRQLQALYDQHLISKEEYEQKRAEILKDL